MQINAVRGIPSLELDFNNRDVLIKGDNGSGKSSIIDAIEFFFTGKLSSFEGAGTQKLSTRRYLNHKNYELSDSEVTITFNPGNKNLTRKYDVIPEIPEEFQEYFNGACKGKFLLRRSEMLKYIVSIPRDRFKAIATILGIDDLDNIELEFKRTNDEYISREREAVLSISEHFTDLSTLLDEEISSIDQVIPALNKKRINLELFTLSNLSELSEPIEKIIPNLKDSSQIEIIKNVLGMQSLIPDSFSDNLSTDLSEINDEVQTLLQDEFNIDDLEKTSLLRLGSSIIKKSGQTTCPLCGQNIDPPHLLAEIEEKLKQLRNLSDSASKIRTLTGSVQTHLERINEQIDNLVECLRDEVQLEDKVEKYKKIRKKIIDFDRELSKVSKIEETINIRQYDEIRSELNQLNLSLSQYFKDKLSEIGDSDRANRLLSHVGEINTIKSTHKRIKELEAKKKRNNKLKKISEILYEKFMETKRDKIEEIYNIIVQDINDFYSILHGDDVHENINLDLSRARSTELTLDFSDQKNVDPRAYASEGHVDSLGLCIFLAFVRKFNEGCSLLILDDVVATIDSNHREFIGKLLEEKFEDFQKIITTHDNIWFEQLSKYGAYQRYQITDWTEVEGPLVAHHIPRWENILQKLEAGDKNSAGAEARRYLEYILKTMSYNTKTKIIYDPYTGGTVNDFYYDLKARMNKLIKDQTERVVIIDRFDKLEKRSFMGNLLTHDNPLADSLHIDEVRRFAESVHELKIALSCENCGGFLTYLQQMKRLTCSNEKCNNPQTIFCK